MSKFLSNMITLSTSTLIGQVLGFLVTPLFSRLYTPADFGFFQLFVSIVGMVAPLSCLSYHYAILLPEKDEDSANILLLCSFLITATVLVVTIILFFASHLIEEVLHAPGFSLYLALLPFAIGFNSFAYMTGYWMSKKENFVAIAKATVYSSFAGKGVTAGYGFLSPSPFGLILGSIVNDVTLCAVIGKKMLSDFSLFSKTSYKKIRELAYRYRKFPTYSLGSDFAGTAAVTVTPFIIAVLFSPVIVGYYSMAYLILRLPSKLVGNAVGTVFFQRASAEKNLTGDIKKVVEGVHTRMLSLGMFACLIMVIIGPELFSLFLGSRWVTAGIYAQIFAPWFFVAFISTPLGFIYNVLEKQAVSFWFNLLLLSSSIVALGVGGLFHNPITGMILLSATGVVFWGWMNMYSLKIAGVQIKEASMEIAKYFLLGLFVCLPLIIARFFSVGPVILIGIAGVLSLGYYSGVVYYDIQLRTGFLHFIDTVSHKMKKLTGFGK